MRLGTPSGLSTMSTGVPSARKGMSSCGTIFDTTPLLPWRPAILSPGWILRFTATKTLTIFITAGRQFVAALQLLDLVEEAAFQPLLRLVVLLTHGLQLGHHRVVVERERPPLRARVLVDDRPVEDLVALEALRAGDGLLAGEDVDEARVDVAIEDREFVVAVLGEPLDLLALDRLGALVLVDAVPVEHPHFDDRALHARRHAGATCRARPRPSRRRWRAAASLPASSGSHPSA